MDNIKERLVEIICQYVDVSKEEIDINMNIRFDIGLDSYSLISLVCDIENEFGISIPDIILMNFVTLSDVVNFVYNELSKLRDKGYLNTKWVNFPLCVK